MTPQYDKAAVRKVTIAQFVLLAILLTIAFGLYYFLVVRTCGFWMGLWPMVKFESAWFWLLPGLCVPLLVFYLFLKLVPSISYLYDENVRTLANLYSLPFMAGYFLLNAFMEELLFRGALQYCFGILPVAVLFTLVHVSYYKKPLLLLEVFVLGIFFGLLFMVTESLWITTIAHAFYNWMLMWLIKTERIRYHA